MPLHNEELFEKFNSFKRTVHTSELELNLSTPSEVSIRIRQVIDLLFPSFWIYCYLCEIKQIIACLKTSYKHCSDGTVFRETVYYELHAVTVRYSIEKKLSGTVWYGRGLKKAVHGTRRYQIFAIPPVSVVERTIDRVTPVRIHTENYYKQQKITWMMAILHYKRTGEWSKFFSVTFLYLCIRWPIEGRERFCLCCFFIG
jgi:hypothetical protein